ncbi:MAG: 50S ribosomal protein L22, partial [Victivallales bacterium]|nr:50S ribosomal protein L22 [Victivallales bacterium]
MEAIAKAKYLRIPARKARRYMGLVKGKSFPEAMAILEFKSSPTAGKIRKVLASAGANAEENHNMVKEALTV